MNRRTLRTVRDDDLPAARVDELSASVLTKPSTPSPRCAPLSGSATPPSTFTPWVSLIAQAEQMLPAAVRQARDQDYTWTQIGRLLNLAPSTTAKRYKSNP